MAKHELTLTVRVAWWLRTYLHCVAFTSKLTGLEPDWQRVAGWVSRGVTVKSPKSGRHA